MSKSLPQAAPIQGPGLFFAIAAALAAATAIVLTAVPDAVEAVRLVIRSTARISLALFLAAFLAAPLTRRWPSGSTRWLVRNRRWLGLSFAFSHLIHALAIVALVRLDPQLFWTLSNPVSVVGGSICYLFIAAMAATSFDRMVQALGPRNWARLHQTGSWIVWLVFVISNAKRIPGSVWYVLPSVVLIAAAWLRLSAVRRTA